MSKPCPTPPLYLPIRDRHAHKGDFGRVLVIGGSKGMAGAPAITACAAVTSGAGLVTVAVPEPCLDTVASFHPTYMTCPLPANALGHFGWNAWDHLQRPMATANALAIGPGMGQLSGAQRILRKLITSQQTRILDADALNLLAQETDWPTKLRGPAILTPHPREWERLSGTPSSDRDAQCRTAREIANQLGEQGEGIIIVKGARSFVTDGTRNYENTTGNPGMASGGTGDCLTGIIAGLVAQGLSPWSAATLGVWLHGRSGDLAASELGEPSTTAVDLIRFLPHAIREAIIKTT